MSSASARAEVMKSSAIARGSRPAVGRAPAGSGGSWSNEKALAGASATLDKLLRLLGVVVAAGDHDRAGVLEVADGGNDASLRLLDDGAALRGLVLHLLDEHLGAALRHVPEDLLLDLLGHATQRHGEVFLVDVLEHELHAPVVELDDVLEDEEQHANLLRELRVLLRKRLDHVALRGAIGRVQDVGEALHAARGGVVLG